MKGLITYLALVYARCLTICPQAFQRLMYNLDRRTCDPDAEKYFRRHLDTVVAWPTLLRNECAFFLLYASLLGISAYGFVLSAHGGPGLERYFIPAVSIMFGCSAWRLIWPATSRYERLFLLCLLGSSCYALKVMASPLHFSAVVELLHWNTVNTLLKTDHLLFTRNSLLLVSSYYPGLEIVTDAFCSISGLSPFTSGLIVTGCARLLLILSFFLLNEQLFKSSRIASLATLFYMANPHFFFFDAQYRYESLALPLLILVLWLLEPCQILSAGIGSIKINRYNVALLDTYRKNLRQRLVGIALLTTLVLAGLTVTHYGSDFYLLVFLLVWTLVYSRQQPAALWRSLVLHMLLLAVLLALINTLRPINPLPDHLSTLSNRIGHNLISVVQGPGKLRSLFASYTGLGTPVWLRLCAIASVSLILICFPFGLLCLLRLHRLQSLARTFALLALCYPLSLILRLGGFGAALADQAAAFLFIPLAPLLALACVQLFPVRTMCKLQVTIVAGLITIILVGSVVIGAGPGMKLWPDAYFSSAAGRSIEFERMQAALWTRTYLPSGNQLAATDRVNQVLQATYGEQHSVTMIAAHSHIAPHALSGRTRSSDELRIMRQGRLRYLVVDLRLERARSSKELFQASTYVNTIFDSGDMIIYDIGAVSHAS
ncbi:hypothetical protein [Dictyobacter formicarum]|uniref:Glycosyltransferase RgtA/B/C/D-like domain-containing protein n=1 Tax=Dictyobacter formicarum TaxID=2778368 RepID=A0ABQ3V8G1_9CHLR|nr:hypothetical protein [Dictyobacter formicarum]GHO82108.1 hypothetical protein KSZ_01140 [Dictyobacter formicarum]